MVSTSLSASYVETSFLKTQPKIGSWTRAHGTTGRSFFNSNNFIFIHVANDNHVRTSRGRGRPRRVTGHLKGKWDRYLFWSWTELMPFCLNSVQFPRISTSETDGPTDKLTDGRKKTDHRVGRTHPIPTNTREIITLNTFSGWTVPKRRLVNRCHRCGV